jgi:predicted alpha-1,2-mannosidase
MTSRFSISRRSFLQTSAAATAATCLPKLAFALNAPAPGTDEPVDWVDPRIGTGGHGHCFPGAAVPFGAVQLSPDTYDDGWDWCAGYHISDTSIMGFSHTHLSGTGCGDLLDFLVMPGKGDVKIVPGSRKSPEQGYRSAFSHNDEVVKPGYYSVLLKDPNVRAELSATDRAGIHKYTFLTGGPSWLIVDLQHCYGGAKQVASAEITHPAPDTLAGGRATNSWGHDRQVFFSMQFSKTPEKIVFYQDDKEVAPSAKLEGKNLKAVVHFNAKPNEVIFVKTGISGVSAENAAANVKHEIPAWVFDKVRADASRRWKEQIGKIRVKSANETHKRIFYTALYHMSLGPVLFDDVDGSYRGMDDQVHKMPAGHHNYTTFSCWDTFRAAHPAYTLFEGDRVPDFANALINMAVQSPKGMPVWPLQGTETGTMTGYHSASIIAEAINKNFPGIDQELAYKCMMKRAMVDDYRGLQYYRKMNYIPADLEEESVSKTFEYCYNDWAIAHVAKKLGHADDAEMLAKRSLNYRNYFDTETQFMRPKLADGKFTSPFDPIDLGHSKKWRDYTESNAWQTTFGTMHDPAGLIELFGGREPFLKKLDALFTVPSTLPADAPPDIAGLVGQYAHGNEPSHHIAYLYVYAGAPWKTQARVRSLMETMYRALPDGIEGNEDVGQMSAWYIISALGFYSVDPVSGNYILGSPLFESATVNMANGKKLEVEVQRKDPSHAYIQSFTLNGQPQKRAWFNHTDIANGGKLTFVMSAEPNKDFAASESEIPPSLKLA